jgi:hypothetical protein
LLTGFDGLLLDQSGNKKTLKLRECLRASIARTGPLRRLMDYISSARDASINEKPLASLMENWFFCRISDIITATL